MRVPLLNQLLHAGTNHVSSAAEQRNIRIANFVSLAMAGILAVIILNSFLQSGYTGWFMVPLALEMMLFMLFILLNFFGYSTFSRIVLCWITASLVLINLRTLLTNIPYPETSHYVGLRVFQIAYTCFPFLVFSTSDWRRLLVALSIPLLSIFLYDPILALMDVGYWQMGLNESSYGYNTFRTFLAWLVISSSFIFLKRIIENQEKINNRLIDELTEKNDIIKKQSDNEVNQLNAQLMANLQELTKHEFILGESQKIAKLGSWEYDAREKSMFWSEQIYEILEVDRFIDLKVPTINKILFGEAEPIIRKTWRDLLHKKKSTDVTVNITTPRGTVKWLRILGYPTTNQENEISGAMGVIQDITYFKESEERLLSSQRNYRTLFERASDAIIISDLNGNFIDVNPSTCKMLGYEKEELVHHNIAEFIEPEHFKTNPIKFEELWAGKRVIQERIYVHKNGSKVSVEVSIKKVDENKLIAVARDITERKQSAQKLLKHIRELALLNTIITISPNATNVHRLLSQVCETLVSDGGYSLAWIGQFPVSPGDHIVKPLVSLGEATAYTKELVIDFYNEEHKKGPTIQALLNCKTTVVNKMSVDANFGAWLSLADKHGLQSSMCVCINADPITRYSLSVYSKNPNAFDFDEVAILERIANTVSSSIKSILASAERDVAKRELQKTYERLHYHVGNTPLAVIEMDKDFIITNWNKRAEELFGWNKEEATGRKKHDFLIPAEDYLAVSAVADWINDDNITSNFFERRNVTKDGRTLYCEWYYSLLRNDRGEVQAILAFISDVTEQKLANIQLSKRIKELTTLHQVSELLHRENEHADDLLQNIAEILPQGWQYPEICGAKIEVAGKTFISSVYKASAYRQLTELHVNNELAGSVEVVYLEEKPVKDEGPFLKEERDLINTIAEMVRIYLEENQKESALNQAQANLSSTINNTEIQIWSVDRNLKLLSYNKAFEEFIAKHFDTTLMTGTGVFEKSKHARTNEVSAKWKGHYTRALSGEVFTVEGGSFGRDYTYSLSPIIEKNIIIGVSVFGYDVTERNARDKALAEANKKIGELKVMALRSVMNPHFIFNVLNSIQFFIANNDRVNAINYLSTFSKLIRMVLTHSVADKITLADEREMLKNYIQLEKVRFDDKFDYNLEIDDGINPDDTYIPSLLIQPYVENAILHGLYMKQGRGKLTIRITEENEYLVIKIEDNGIGREAANQLKGKQQKLHKSMGTKLTEERLKLINDESGVAVSFTDLFDGSEPAGTCVTIKIKSY